jgi:tripartite-type tricarboxylate transporter receptor subunit TctC
VIAARHLHTIGVCALVCAVVYQAIARAEDAYPARPIVLVVPFPPGGSGDVQARILAAEFAHRLGQNVLVDNRPGAGTAIGAAYVARSNPDGYTLLLSSASTFTLNPAINRALPYDPIKSFQPVGMISSVGLVMLATPNVPVTSLNEVVAVARAAPNSLAYASLGAGTTSHFVAAMAAHAMGIRLTHVPYRGSAMAMNDLIGGHVPLFFDTVTSAAPQIRAGKVRALAVTSARRSPLLPDVPTFAESGYPEVVFDSWGMLVAPRGLPAPVLARLESALSETIADPSVRRSLFEQGVEAKFRGSSASAAHLEAELPLMRAVARWANIQPE